MTLRSAEAPDVIVLGGGVIGCSIAFHLARRGVPTLLVERGEPGAEASEAASGIVLPHPGDDVLDRLANESSRMFPSVVDELRGLGAEDPLYERTGRIDAALTEREAEELKAWVPGHERAGIGARWLEAEEARRVEPLIAPDVAGALHVPESACVSGGALARAFARAAVSLGARVRTGAGDAELVRRGGAVVGVRTGDGEVAAAGAVVLAGGAWSARAAAGAGLDLRVEPVRGQNLRLRMPPGTSLTLNVYHGETILVPRPGGRVVAGVTIESVGFDSRATVDGIASILERAERLVPALAGAAMEQAYAGLRPATPDGLPLIGRPRGVDGLVVATGHHRMGIALSPVTGRLVADHIADGAELPHEFRPDRGFEGG